MLRNFTHPRPVRKMPIKSMKTRNQLVSVINITEKNTLNLFGGTMKYKATEKFKELGIENSYQGLTVGEYFSLNEGKATKLKFPPKRLINGKYIEKVKGE